MSVGPLCEIPRRRKPCDPDEIRPYYGRGFDLKNRLKRDATACSAARIRLGKAALFGYHEGGINDDPHANG
jgi:hypothetical protein